MAKYFNIAGPCHPAQHYMVPAQARCQDLMPLVERGQYFVIHAARQTGKTTLLKDSARRLEAEGRYHALYVSLESLQEVTEPEKGLRGLVGALAHALKWHPVLKARPFAVAPDFASFTTVLKAELTQFCAQVDRPLVILFDEADCLSNGTLITFLRQLRDGYIGRPDVPFVHAVALVGMRNIRDYKARIRPDSQTLGSASPFNIVTESLTLRNFTPEEVARLCAQHTAETGQPFSEPALERVKWWTRGQPWLVNAVARECVEKILANEFSRAVEAAHVEEAVQRIILRRDTHIDSLMERLKEPRVRRIIEPMLLGEGGQIDRLEDDYQYTRDLGLVATERGVTGPANPVYAEVIVRTLSFRAQDRLDEEQRPYLAPRYALADGGLDVKHLLTDFQQFWRENAEAWTPKLAYGEAAAHLILMAFVQRVVNAGGSITREFASGRGRLDLCLHWQGRRYAVELKVLAGPRTYEQGKEQLGGYLQTLGLEEGWLVVFDRRAEVPWDEKIFWRTETFEGRTMHLVGC